MNQIGLIEEKKYMFGFVVVGDRDEGVVEYFGDKDLHHCWNLEELFRRS